MGSLYHMVESLSEFHHSYRDYANKYWIETTGPLNKKEKEALENFKKVVKNYPFGHPKYLGKFLETKPEPRALKKLHENVNNKEYEVIIETLEVFKPRFQKIWLSQLKDMRTWKIRLVKEVENHNKEITTEIANFLPKEPILDDINVFLLISGPPNGYVSGGANLGPQRITLEVGVLPKKHLGRVLTVFWHEVFHAVAGTTFNNDILSYLSNYLKKYSLPKDVLNIEPGKDPLGILNEGVTKIFETHISDKYYDYQIRDRAKENLKALKNQRRKLASLNYYAILNNGLDMLRDYIHRGKKLDKRFLDNLVKQYQAFAKDINK